MKLPGNIQSSTIKFMVFLVSAFLSLWCSNMSLSAAEITPVSLAEMNAVEASRCESIVAEYSDEHDDAIQKKLREAYKNDACFEQKKNVHGRPLSDAIVGPITKTWINQYMMDYTEKACAPDDGICMESIRKSNGSRNNSGAAGVRLSENGIRPYLLTEDDLTYFEINPDVYAVLKAMESKSFITENALLNAVKSDFSSIKNISDGLLTVYADQVRSYIQQVNEKMVTAETIDLLIVNNYMLAATGLQSQVGKPVSEENFSRLIKNILRATYLENKKKSNEILSVIKNGKTTTKDTSFTESEDKKLAKKIAKIKIKKSIKLSKKQNVEINKIIKIVDLTANKYLQYKLSINKKVKNDLPSIDSEIVECVRSIANTEYYSKFSMEDSLKEILRNIGKIQAGVKVSGFNCKISVKFPDVKKSLMVPDELKKDGDNYDKAALNLLLKKAGKPFYGANLEPVELVSFENCNDCSLPMKGINYGFYPFWQASAAYKNIGLPVLNPAAVDFSVFSRIAYSALPVSSDGSIENLLHWKDSSNIKSFVASLNKYNVKRDLVLYSNSWQLWGAGKGVYDIKQVVQGYAEMHLSQIQKLHKSVESEGGISGITLYFDGYKRDSDANNIVNYIAHLQQEVIKGYKNRTMPAFDINLVLGISWDYHSDKYCRVGSVDKKSDTYFKEFESLLIKDVDNQMPSNLGEITGEIKDKIESKLKGNVSSITKPALMNLLVFLHEPSSRAKKCLRLQIENEFHGGRRIDILRKVIPVLGRPYLKERDNVFKQFADDINYLKDNFGGIGMWPLPMSRVLDEEDGTNKRDDINSSVISKMSKLIEKKYNEPYKNYVDYSKLGVIGEALNQPVMTSYFSICSYMCPDRSTYNYLLLLLISVSITSFVAFQVNCKARKYIIKIKWFDIAIKSSTLIVLLSVLGCDPFWQPMSNTILLMSVVSGVGYFLYSTFFCGYESERDE